MVIGRGGVVVGGTVVGGTVGLWVPEVGGPVDPTNEAHELVMVTIAGMSKAERNRIKIRVQTALAALAERECRYLLTRLSRLEAVRPATQARPGTRAPRPGHERVPSSG